MLSRFPLISYPGWSGLPYFCVPAFVFLLRVIFVKAVAIIDAYSSQYWIAWPFHSFVKETVPLLLS